MKAFFNFLQNTQKPWVMTLRVNNNVSLTSCLNLKRWMANFDEKESQLSMLVDRPDSFKTENRRYLHLPVVGHYKLESVNTESNTQKTGYKKLVWKSENKQNGIQNHKSPIIFPFQLTQEMHDQICCQHNRSFIHWLSSWWSLTFFRPNKKRQKPSKRPFLTFCTHNWTVMKHCCNIFLVWLRKHQLF